MPSKPTKSKLLGVKPTVCARCGKPGNFTRIGNAYRRDCTRCANRGSAAKAAAKKAENRRIKQARSTFGVWRKVMGDDRYDV